MTEEQVREEIEKILDKYGSFNTYTDCMEFDVSHKNNQDDYDNAIYEIAEYITTHTNQRVKEIKETINKAKSELCDDFLKAQKDDKELQMTWNSALRQCANSVDVKLTNLVHALTAKGEEEK